MKKSWLILSLITLISISLASAYISGGPVQGLQQLLDGVTEAINIFMNFLFNIGFYDEFIFVKFLLLLIIFIVSYTVLKRMDLFSKPMIAFVIAACVSILAVRFIPSTDFLQAMLLPYTTLGISLTIFLPFLIFFYFVHHSMNLPVSRRIAWLLFAAVFFGTWYSRYEVIGEANWIYWIGIGITLLMVIFDHQIHSYFGIQEWKNARRELKLREIANLKSDVARWQPLAASDPSMRRLIERNNKRIHALERGL